MQAFVNYISQPSPWYIAGPSIGFVIIFLQWMDNKPLAASSSYRHICASVFPAGVPFLKYNWKAESWNLFCIAGIVIGGFLAGNILTHPANVPISDEAKIQLQSTGIQGMTGSAPAQLFSFAAPFGPLV